jgi:hypothetical protein
MRSAFSVSDVWDACGLKITSGDGAWVRIQKNGGQTSLKKA